MNKKQTFELLKAISALYPIFEVTQLKIDLWTTTLVEQEYEEMMKNLSNYAKYNQFPPKISDLLKEDHEVKYTGPTVAETKTMFSQWDRNSEDIAPPEEREKHLKEIAKILGIKRRGRK
ncbi:replicative helicase loader/inhibitor [Bacillus mycoides]|uniref:replicative helicase loader/inhibitor n=1 Tax=Bacillus mycoides TaxID=1405 RepID=UPI002E1CC8FB|nr:replicative helicase loader/inhibitor [Bacillus mycoides]